MQEYINKNLVNIYNEIIVQTDILLWDNFITISPFCQYHISLHKHRTGMRVSAAASVGAFVFDNVCHRQTAPRRKFAFLPYLYHRLRPARVVAPGTSTWLAAQPFDEAWEQNAHEQGTGQCAHVSGHTPPTAALTKKAVCCIMEEPLRNRAYKKKGTCHNG